MNFQRRRIYGYICFRMACIGVFDSGSGGLSVLKEILRILPGERYIYYADNANCPYGEKSTEFITSRSIAISEDLLKEGAQAIVVACNTATGAAIKVLREKWPEIPFIGMEPAVKPAVKESKTGTIGILATKSTLGAEKYRLTRDRFAHGMKVFEHPGEGFVELVEQGQLDGPQVEETVWRSLLPLLENGADTIVLGCTHYPFLLPVLQRLAGENVKFIDPAPAVARRLAQVLKEKGIALENLPHADIQIKSSGQDDSARRILAMVKRSLGEVG